MSKDKLSDNFNVKLTPKWFKLSLSKGKRTKSKALDKAATSSKGKTTNIAATGPLNDCTDSLKCSRFVAAVSYLESARGVIQANTNLGY